MYAEMIQDRSFDALAYTTGFSQQSAEYLDLVPTDFLAQGLSGSTEDLFLTAGGRNQLR